MATTQPTPREGLSRCNSTVAAFYGMSVKTYKLIKAVTQLAAVAAGLYAMSLGAAPMLTFALVATIVTGPEALEMLIADQEPPGGEDS